MVLAKINTTFSKLNLGKLDDIFAVELGLPQVKEKLGNMMCSQGILKFLVNVLSKSGKSPENTCSVDADFGNGCRR